jgi:hypothetical protein
MSNQARELLKILLTVLVQLQFIAGTMIPGYFTGVQDHWVTTQEWLRKKLI